MRTILSLLLAVSAVLLQGPVMAQSPASGDDVPEAAAGQCVSVIPTGSDIILQNSCGYRIAVALCVPRNASERILCKPENGVDDISIKTLFISPRGNIGTNFPNGSSIYQMACRATAKPVLVSATGGKCVAR